MRAHGESFDTTSRKVSMSDAHRSEYSESLHEGGHCGLRWPGKFERGLKRKGGSRVWIVREF